MSMKTNRSESMFLINYAGQIYCPYFLFPPSWSFVMLLYWLTVFAGLVFWMRMIEWTLFQTMFGKGEGYIPCHNVRCFKGFFKCRIPFYARPLAGHACSLVPLFCDAFLSLRTFLDWCLGMPQAYGYPMLRNVVPNYVVYNVSCLKEAFKSTQPIYTRPLSGHSCSLVPLFFNLQILYLCAIDLGLLRMSSLNKCIELETIINQVELILSTPLEPR